LEKARAELIKLQERRGRRLRGVMQFDQRKINKRANWYFG